MGLGGSAGLAGLGGSAGAAEPDADGLGGGAGLGGFKLVEPDSGDGDDDAPVGDDDDEALGFGGGGGLGRRSGPGGVEVRGLSGAADVATLGSGATRGLVEVEATSGGGSCEMIDSRALVWGLVPGGGGFSRITAPVDCVVVSVFDIVPERAACGDDAEDANFDAGLPCVVVVVAAVAALLVVVVVMVMVPEILRESAGEGVGEDDGEVPPPVAAASSSAVPLAAPTAR
jgi:hypothetical protein